MENSWYYDESRQIGTDYNNLTEVVAYDKGMSKLREPSEEAAQIVAALGLTGNEIVADIGCGTAELTVRLAPHCAQVFAVDISEEMLKFAKRKAQARGLTNIRFELGGFLSWQHNAGSMDAIVSCLALHHLPDFWKVVSLQKARSLLRPGGKLYLTDVIYAFDVSKHSEVFNSWCEEIGKRSPGMADSVLRHIRQEYSTTSWLLESMLKETGFRIEKAHKDNFHCTYVCIK